MEPFIALLKGLRCQEGASGLPPLCVTAVQSSARGTADGDGRRESSSAERPRLLSTCGGSGGGGCGGGESKYGC